MCASGVNNQPRWSMTLGTRKKDQHRPHQPLPFGQAQVSTNNKTIEDKRTRIDELHGYIVNKVILTYGSNSLYTLIVTAGMPVTNCAVVSVAIATRVVVGATRRSS